MYIYKVRIAPEATVLGQAGDYAPTAAGAPRKTGTEAAGLRLAPVASSRPQATRRMTFQDAGKNPRL